MGERGRKSLGFFFCHLDRMRGEATNEWRWLKHQEADLSIRHPQDGSVEMTKGIKCRDSSVGRAFPW